MYIVKWCVYREGSLVMTTGEGIKKRKYRSKERIEEEIKDIIL
jgi:hypothetical protein